MILYMDQNKGYNMGNKKRPVPVRENHGDPPRTLEGHNFFGLELDNEQIEFRDAIWNPDIDIVFCNAPAGSGKTTVALGAADLLVKYRRYDKIIYLMAPTQEAKIGYRPGDTGAKLAPYFRPLYDAAIKLGINPYSDINDCTDDWKGEGDGYINCMSNIFLRGCNIDERTILIFDEAQNAYADEVKTILTRVHDGTKSIIIGHSGQCDLYKYPERSGFAPYIEHFKGQDRCAICELKNNHRGWVSRHADALVI